MKNKTKAFTLVEITIVLVVIAVIAVICLSTVFKKGGIDTKKNAALSHSFYASMNKAFIQTVNQHTSKYTINTLYKFNTTTAGGTSQDLIKYLIKYGDGKSNASNDFSCTELKLPSSLSSYITNAKCASFPGSIIAGAYLNTSCNSTAAAKQYLTLTDDAQPDTTTRNASNTCGWIIYSFRGASELVLGKDIFIIPFGKSGLLVQ